MARSIYGTYLDAPKSDVALLYQQGFSQTCIAIKYGVHRCAVERFFKKHKIKTRRQKDAMLFYYKRKKNL